VGQVLAGIEPFAFTLGRLGHFPAVTYLAPDPAWAFLDITQRVWARWPSHPPYAGDFAADVPHVSVTGDEAEIGRRLPIQTEATEVLLLVEGEGRWVERARFPLGRFGVTPAH
jgi:hypothetical protein